MIQGSERARKGLRISNAISDANSALQQMGRSFGEAINGADSIPNGTKMVNYIDKISAKNEKKVENVSDL